MSEFYRLVFASSLLYLLGILGSLCFFSQSSYVKDKLFECPTFTYSLWEWLEEQDLGSTPKFSQELQIQFWPHYVRLTLIFYTITFLKAVFWPFMLVKAILISVFNSFRYCYKVFQNIQIKPKSKKVP